MAKQTVLEKEKFCRFILLKKKIFSLVLIIFIYITFTDASNANFQQKLVDKFKSVNTLHFNFTQTIGDKVEKGSCYIKYPLLMNCYYPKKNKSIITNGKKLAIIKKRYKKIYYYPLKKTPLFYILNKKTILDTIQNYEPNIISSNIIGYQSIDSNSNKLNILFDKNSLELLGWQTKDAYSNEVNFLIENMEINILINSEVFKIPNVEDL